MQHLRVIFGICVLLFLCLIGLLIVEYVMPITRPIDLKPITQTSQKNILPPEQAQVSLTIDTSGDQMSFRRWQAGLGYSVRYGNTVVHQNIASCNDAGILSSPHEPVSNTEASCDGMSYQFTVDEHRVSVIQKNAGSTKTIATITLPTTVTTITYDEPETDKATNK